MPTLVRPEFMTDDVLEAMRDINTKAQRYLETYYKLAPRYGEVATGGEHFDAFVKGESLCEFLSSLRRGSSPLEAAIMAKSYAAELVANWNSKPQAAALSGHAYQLHRWTGMADALIEDAMRQVLNAVRDN